ncbi:MAG TPA: hypothetical protein PKY33_08845 [Limnohabitans sp.]|uniref:hypothetical protein n=1 Tax=Limnohabitans sp. TaxID=1907725 RepID=UPI0026AE1376|nr:hypothetical protein [Limnohabitans sp.]HQR86842.1 hypothetical protein [Limnohabitans sp.]HQS27061.1 hypothetical protein [Limnohabitans sp.]
MGQLKLIALDQIRIDGATQFRDQINQDVVKEYKQAMLDGAEFPPMQCTFDGKHYWLWDGFHRYLAIKSIGIKQAEVEFMPGAQEDAQDLALSANAHHGHNRNNETKRKQVEAALAMTRHAEKSNRELAKLCQVSDKFVAAIRNLEAKEKQESNRKNSNEKKYSSAQNDGKCDPIALDVNLTDSPAIEGQHLDQGHAPDEEELKAMELAMEADRKLLNDILDSNEPMKLLHDEVTRLNYLVAQKEIRIASLMNEKNTAVKMVNDLQRQVDRANQRRN